MIRCNILLIWEWVGVEKRTLFSINEGERKKASLGTFICDLKNKIQFSYVKGTVGERERKREQASSGSLLKWLD